MASAEHSYSCGNCVFILSCAAKVLADRKILQVAIAVIILGHTENCILINIKPSRHRNSIQAVRLLAPVQCKKARQLNGEGASRLLAAIAADTAVADKECDAQGAQEGC